MLSANDKSEPYEPASVLLRRVLLKRHSNLWFRRHRDLAIVISVTLGLRLLFAALLADTYDPDEFVYLTLGHALAAGHTPYRDFMIFHPPGLLVLLRLFDPLIGLWWPLARLLEIAADTITAACIWRLGRILFDARTAVLAALLYAVQPIALLSAVRVGPDPIITMLGFVGLTGLLAGRSQRATVLAGVCLGLAVWCKYPAILFAPVYLLAAPKRAKIWAPVSLLTAGVLFAPLLPEAHQFYDQTVHWQLVSRGAMDRGRQLHLVLVFWLLANPFAVIGVLRRRPAWVILGFGLGVVFLDTSHVFYHYFVPMAAFGALLGAPIAAKVLRLPLRVLLLASATFTVAWGLAITHNGPGRDLVSASRFSLVSPVVHTLEKRTTPKYEILADRFEYAFLAHRIPTAYYYWDVMFFAKASALQKDLSHTSAVVFTHQPYQSFPGNFSEYLDHHYRRLEVGGATIWTIHSRGCRWPRRGGASSLSAVVAGAVWTLHAHHITTIR